MQGDRPRRSASRGLARALLNTSRGVFSTLYRKSPPTPPKLLLRIVATAGASALLGVAACSDSTSGFHGVGVVDATPPPDSGDDSTVGVGVVGSVAYLPDAGHDTGLPCGTGVCGVVAMPHDAGEAGTDSGLPCGIGFCGTVVMPHDAGEAGHPEGGSDQ